MADVTLSDGREITFDLSAFTLKQFIELREPKVTEEESDSVIARACHMSHAEVIALSYLDYKKILKRFFEVCAKPLDDSKNSLSAPS